MPLPRLRLVLATLLILAITLIASRASTHAASALDAAAAPGKLLVNIPYPAAEPGPGHLSVELLDPEDHVLGHTERRAEISGQPGAWRQAIVPDQPLAFNDAVWQRVRWRFTYNSGAPALSGIEPVAEILLRPVVQLIGQSDYLAGSQASLRVIVTDGTSAGLVTSGAIRMTLAKPGNGPAPAIELYRGRLDRRGSLEAQFRLPAGVTGDYQLHVYADTPLGALDTTQNIRIADQAQILLTSEKPIYQPGQLIHLRALALDRAEHHAIAGRPLTFQVEDSRGNKVFRSSAMTDRFGIASSAFQLADEVNLGAYHVRALLGNAQTPTNTAELAVTVERYVLPKFKVAIAFDKKNAATGREVRDFRPGDHVTGTVRANYFFGKPVDHAALTIKASAMDVELAEAASAAGRTDADGVYHFDLKLPDFFAGKPLSAGAARVLVEASVKDSAAHTELRGEPITVSPSALLITAVPESGALLPGLENQVYVLTSYPDGTPASTTLSASAAGAPAQQATTDASGVATIHVRPGPGETTFAITADDHHGSRASTTVSLAARDGADQVLLRTNRSVLKAGEKLELHVLSTRQRGAAYVDLIRNGQTVLTRDLDLQNGQAALTLTVTPEMAGTLDADAYLFGRDAQPIADHRLLFVQPADELRVTSTTSAAVYQPGAEATIRFHVANARGEGVSAALGVQIVDEAVFALAEEQPGFAKTFFYLEQEVMKPRFEIHSLSLDQVVTPRPTDSLSDSRPTDDLDARALFAATDLARPHQLSLEVGRELPEEHHQLFTQRYQAVFAAEVHQIAARLTTQIRQPLRGDAFLQAFHATRLPDGSLPRDAWGNPLQVTKRNWYGTEANFFEVRSAGPDRRLNTPDDLVLVLEETARPQPGAAVVMEHARGPFNGLAELTGSIFDSAGAIIPRAHIHLRQIQTGEERDATANAAGSFTLPGLPRGDYQLTITSLGFETMLQTIHLDPRDRAIVTAHLAAGSATESFTVFVGTADSVEATGTTIVDAPIGTFAMPMMAAAAPSSLAARQTVRLSSGGGAGVATTAGDAGAAPAHVRSFFPEALYINPEIITDGHGDASITVPVADSITTWRMAMLASNERGALGSGASSLKVFQDFFVDLDLPITLTKGDQVSIPVAIYNYSGAPGQVSLKLQQDPWFTLVDDQPQRSLATQSGVVSGSSFTLRAARIGKFKLTLTAHLAGVNGQPGREDILVREIEVIPDGQEQSVVANGRLDRSAEQTLRFPANALPDATTLFVRLYPGPLSQLVEGMDAILHMPYGCFEQTSSATYPNVLALDYMKQSGKLTPEIHAKAEGFIANGYQRLLTFEVPGGGFSWFGRAPANKILTAYGLMEFHDMAQVSDVDPRLITRTANWLAAQQQPDGSWRPDTSFINEGATNRYNSDVLRITAYLAWSLAETGYQGPATERALHYITAHDASGSARPDPYTLAVIANFAVDYGKDRAFTRQAMQALLDARTGKGDLVFWDAPETSFHATGSSAATETTGLATQALLKWGESPEISRKALAFLAAGKQASGTWGTTQATIMALRSLLLATKASAADARGTVTVTLNGKPVQTLTLTPENNDLLHQIAVPNLDPAQPAQVALTFDGSGGLAYQIAGRFYTPWPARDQTSTADKPALAIAVTYDRSRLAENDIAQATATIHNNLPGTADLIMVDLGIPPGFELLSEDLQTMVEQTAHARGGKLEKFSQTATQAILYFDALAPGQTVQVHYRLRAKYPVRAQTFASRVYVYYTPEINASASPRPLEVTRAAPAGKAQPPR